MQKLLRVCVRASAFGSGLKVLGLGILEGVACSSFISGITTFHESRICASTGIGEVLVRVQLRVFQPADPELFLLASDPKGPCTQMYPNRDYFKAKANTIWANPFFFILEFVLF